MKQILMALLVALPVTAAAQNTWEIPQEETTQKQTALFDTKNDGHKTNPKYLEGAVPVNADGKVEFTLDADAPGLTAAQIYDRIYLLMNQLVKESNQLKGSKVAAVNKDQRIIATVFKEDLIFQKSLLSLDETEFDYTIIATCTDGHLHATLGRISYAYELNREGGFKAPAEEVITDEWALTKNKNKLAKYYGKFRQKTIDRKDNLFQQMRDALKR